jgi:hypothetical protein
VAISNNANRSLGLNGMMSALYDTGLKPNAAQCPLCAPERSFEKGAAVEFVGKNRVNSERQQEERFTQRARTSASREPKK